MAERSKEGARKTPSHPMAGFTMVELLIVAALIGILAALTLPTYSGARRLAYNGMALTDLTSVRTAVLGEVATLPASGAIAISGPAAFPLAPNVRISRGVTVRVQLGGSNGNNGNGYGKGGNGRGNNGNGKGNQGGGDLTSTDTGYTITATHNQGSATYQTDETGEIIATGTL